MDDDALWDALGILSRAKLACIDELYRRIKSGARNGFETLEVFDVLTAFSAADGAWNRVFAEYLPEMQCSCNKRHSCEAPRG